MHTPTPTHRDLEAEGSELTLDRLSELSRDELDRWFLWASTPSIRELDGATDGRALAGRVPADALPWMPWKGKRFEPIDEARGRGGNRIESSVLELIKLELFEFETRIEAPIFGDDPVVVLDYDLEKNPALIRRVHDELKKLRDGLFLGRAYIRRRARPRFVLYFALQLR